MAYLERVPLGEIIKEANGSIVFVDDKGIGSSKVYCNVAVKEVKESHVLISI